MLVSFEMGFCIALPVVIAIWIKRQTFSVYIKRIKRRKTKLHTKTKVLSLKNGAADKKTNHPP